MRNLIFLVLFILPLWGTAQQSFLYDQEIPVQVDGNFLSMPFAGGINAAQIQSMDVNGDGNDELILWDINARRISVYKTSGEEPVVLPEMAYFFPTDVNGFLVLADFDGDGKKDLFTSTPFGIKAYKNITEAGNSFPQWEVAREFLRLENGSNLQTNNLDIPLIMDLDGDGDLDIATFNFASGDYLQFYLNTSVERTGLPDIDGYAFPINRWGNFEFCGCGTFSFGVTCAGFPIGREIIPSENQRMEHSGGHSMLYHDFDGDGISDLLMGQDECNTLYFLPNKGTNSAPIFNEFFTGLPRIGTLPKFPVFHAAHLFQNELIISSNSSTSAALYQSDYARNIFNYPLENGPSTGMNNFLQKDMIDLGENSRPFFRGNSGAGELIVTSNTLVEGRIIGIATLYSVGNEGWELVERDYLNLSELQLTNIQYQEYRNSQGDYHFFLAGVDTADFAFRKQILYNRSENFMEAEAIVVPGTGIQPLDHFEFFNYQNRDYMLLAKQTGELVIFDVDFSNGVSLSLHQSEFLGFADNPANRNLTVHVIPGSSPSLYAVDQRGILFFMEDFMDQNEKEEVQIAVGEMQTEKTRLGRNTWMTHISDPFGQQFDLVLGNTAGGIRYFKIKDTGQTPSEEQFMAKVYPNPSSGPIKIIVSQSATVRLISTLGHILVNHFNVPANTETELQIQSLSPGLYILQLTNEKGERISKKVMVKN